MERAEIAKWINHPSTHIYTFKEAIRIVRRGQKRLVDIPGETGDRGKDKPAWILNEYGAF